MKETSSKSPASAIPNCITTLGLLCGLIAIVFSFSPSADFGGLKGYEWTWIFIGGALVCDFCDGFSARLLDAYSDLGKNLDSLSDLVSFGLAPCFLIFNLIAEYHPGWSFVTWLPLLIPVCGAFRLARFNIDPNQKTIFNGLPIPANAIFWVGFSPLLIIANDMPAWVATLALIVISFLMVTPMPMFSLKVQSLKMDAENWLRLIQVVASVLLVVFLGIEGLMWVTIVYVALSFFSFFFLIKDN